MKQEIQRFSIRSFYDGYKETADDVVAFGGLLNVRPKFQREFIYPPDKQEAVIQSILKNCIIGFFIRFNYISITNNYTITYNITS